MEKIIVKANEMKSIVESVEIYNQRRAEIPGLAYSIQEHYLKMKENFRDSLQKDLVPALMQLVGPLPEQLGFAEEEGLGGVVKSPIILVVVMAAVDRFS